MRNRYQLLVRRRTSNGTLHYRRHEGARYEFIPREGEGGAAWSALHLYHSDGTLAASHVIRDHESDRKHLECILYDHEMFGGEGGFVRLPI